MHFRQTGLVQISWARKTRGIWPAERTKRCHDPYRKAEICPDTELAMTWAVERHVYRPLNQESPVDQHLGGYGFSVLFFNLIIFHCFYGIGFFRFIGVKSTVGLRWGTLGPREII